MQCGPDKPSWTWTQIWIQTRMPDYSLNWTARMTKVPVEAGGGAFGLKSAIEHWLSCMDARQSAEKPLYEAEIFQYWPCLRNTTSFILPRYRKSRGTSHYTTVCIFFSVLDTTRRRHHLHLIDAIVINIQRPYLPTPPLGQDMTQGQFLSGVQQVWIQSFPSPRLVASPRLKNLVCPTIYP